MGVRGRMGQIDYSRPGGQSRLWDDVKEKLHWRGLNRLGRLYSELLQWDQD